VTAWQARFSKVIGQQRVESGEERETVIEPFELMGTPRTRSDWAFGRPCPLAGCSFPCMLSWLRAGATAAQGRQARPERAKTRAFPALSLELWLLALPRPCSLSLSRPSLPQLLAPLSLPSLPSLFFFFCPLFLSSPPIPKHFVSGSILFSSPLLPAILSLQPTSSVRSPRLSSLVALSAAPSEPALRSRLISTRAHR
jgi:hypothetical protein